MFGFVKLSATKAILYLWEQMIFFPRFQYLLSDLGETGCKKSTHNSVDLFLSFVNRHREWPCLSYVNKRSYIYLSSANRITF
jgi:hypothetical protein